MSAYRRRMRWPLAIVVAPLLVFVGCVSAMQRIYGWSFAAGAAAATAVAFVMFVRDDAPWHVQKWGQGAAGERATERSLRRLARSGWDIRHDIERPTGGNVDHVASGPRGHFLLETKAPSGTASFEHGHLVVSQIDDPDEVFVYRTLAARVRTQARERSTELGTQTGHRPWVQGVVVLWCRFPQRFVHDDRVVYIHGADLLHWLTTGEAPAG